MNEERTNHIVLIGGRSEPSLKAAPLSLSLTAAQNINRKSEMSYTVSHSITWSMDKKHQKECPLLNILISSITKSTFNKISSKIVLSCSNPNVSNDSKSKDLREIRFQGLPDRATWLGLRESVESQNRRSWEMYDFRAKRCAILGLREMQF